MKLLRPLDWIVLLFHFAATLPHRLTDPHYATWRSSRLLAVHLVSQSCREEERIVRHGDLLIDMRCRVLHAATVASSTREGCMINPRTDDLLSALDMYTGSFRKTLPPWEERMDSGHVSLVRVASFYEDAQRRLGENFRWRRKKIETFLEWFIGDR